MYFGALGSQGGPMGSHGGDPLALWGPIGPWGPRPLGPIGPWGPVGPWGPIGPWGPLGLRDPWALGTLGPWGPLGLGDPWALGARALGPVYRIYGSTLVFYILVPFFLSIFLSLYMYSGTYIK